MKKIILAATSALLLSLTPTSASAIDAEVLNDVQLGVGIGMVDFGLQDSGLLYYITAQKEMNIILGDFDSFAQFRLGSSSAAKTGSFTEKKFDYIASALFKSSMQLQNDMNAYGLAGFSLASVALNGSSYNDLSFTYGFGLEKAVTPEVKVGFEYTAYSLFADAFAVTGSYKF